MGFFKINGVDFPVPSVGLGFEREQLVDSARNALGEVVAQTINRRLGKFTPLTWNYLTASEWRVIQQAVDDFSASVYYWDNASGAFKTRTFYFGNESATINSINPETGEHLTYTNCTVNLIDMGLTDED